MVRRGRLRWCGHIEHDSADVSAGRNVVLAGARYRGRGRKTRIECMTSYEANV